MPCTCICQLLLLRVKRPATSGRAGTGILLSWAGICLSGSPPRLLPVGPRDFHLCPKKATQGRLGVPGLWAG